MKMNEIRSLVANNPAEPKRRQRIEIVAHDQRPRFDIELPDRFVLFAGKLARSKGAWLALEGFAALADRRAVLLMVGEGPDRSRLETAARERGLAVRFLPWVDNHEVWRIMRRAAAILVPSLWPESLSRTVTEAMAVGVPIIATDCGGIHDQIRHHESGAVLPPDPAAFAAEMARVLADPALGRAWAERARQAVAARFDDAAVLPRIEAVYAEAIEGKRGRGTVLAGGEH